MCLKTGDVTTENPFRMKKNFFVLSTSRKEWLTLKEEYMTLQKRSMSSLKKCMNKIDDKEQKSLMETEADRQHGDGEFSVNKRQTLKLKPQDHRQVTLYMPWTFSKRNLEKNIDIVLFFFVFS